MSLILDALQKSAEQDKGGDSAPVLAMRPSPHPVPERWQWRRLLFQVGALLSVVLLVGWWLLGPVPRQQLPVAEPAAANLPVPAELQVPAVVAPPQPLPVAAGPTAASSTASPSAAEEQQVASLYRQTPDTGQAEPEPESAPAASPPPRSPTTALDVEAIVGAARRQLAAGPEVAHPAPLLVDLPQAVKDQIPSIFYRQHDWSTEAGASSVNLNGEDFGEGDLVLPGLRLLQIHRDFILMDFQGNEFRLRALGSWVNL